MSNLDERLLLSQKKLTLLLGGLAIALPDILYLGNLWIFSVEDRLASLSAYYYSGMGDVFVGIIFSIGMFLITYEGYDKDDMLLATFGGIFAIIVALFPTHPSGVNPDIISEIHNYAAAMFYAVLTVFCMFRFTKTDEKPTFQKKIRNVIYRTCGLVMMVSLLFLMILTISGARPFDKPVFWLEYIANTAFGIAFLVKGEGVFFLNDDPIMEMTPWEIYGLFILVVLTFGNIIVFTNIFL